MHAQKLPVANTNQLWLSELSITHAFHCFKYVGIEDTRRLSKLKHHLQSLNTSIAVPNSQQQIIDTVSINGTNLSTRDQIKNEIETILAADCLFCGEYMINNIDKPFIDDWERVNMDWE